MHKWERKLDGVGKDERQLLQLISVFWEQTNVLDLKQLIQSLGLKTQEGKKYAEKDISRFCQTFVERGLIQSTKGYWGSGFRLLDENLTEHLTREAVEKSWFMAAVEITINEFSLDTVSHWSNKGEYYKRRLLRDLRLAIYQRNRDAIYELFKKIEDESGLKDKSLEMIVQIFSDPFQKGLLDEFKPEFQTFVLLLLFPHYIENSISTEDLWSFVKDKKLEHGLIIDFAIEEAIYRGELSVAKKLIGTPNSLTQYLGSATIALFQGDSETAIGYFESAIDLWRELKSETAGFPEVWQMFLYGLVLFKTDQAKFYVFAEELYLYSRKNYPGFSASREVKYLELFSKNQENQMRVDEREFERNKFPDKLIECLIAAIVPSRNLPDWEPEFMERNTFLGYRWIVFELNNLVALKGGAGSIEAREAIDKLQRELGFAPIGNMIPRIEDWERVINALKLVSVDIEGKRESKIQINKKRIAWQIDFDLKEIQPIEQSHGKTGWSKGRKVSLKKLFGNKVKNLTEQDALVVKNSLTKETDFLYYDSDSYTLNWQKAMLSLVGHPNLFLSKNIAINVQLTKAEPALIIKEIDGNIELSFDIEFETQGCVVKKETEASYLVYEITSHHAAIADSLKHGKLNIPARGSDALMKVIQPLSANIAIQSDLEEFFETLPIVEADKRIHALITPIGEGFHLEFFVKPFGSIPPYLKPGKGRESVIAELRGVRTRTKRDLEHEKKLLAEIEATCPFLGEFNRLDFEWNFSDPESCLRALSEMETPREEGKIVIEWTKGQKLKLLGRIGLDNFSLRVKGNNDWFEVSGEVEINEDLVLSMSELTDLIGNNAEDFVELSDGQFISITEQLRKHLQSLDAVLDDEQRLHGLQSGILEGLAEELEDFTADRAWKDYLAKLGNVRKFVPKLPTNFEGDLRPYQIRGYEWLSRLANWGVGACLADDMGLGKTLQALAVLVERAEKGSALVVAPVSACRNWVKEAKCFAPTLNFQIFGAGDRNVAVKNLGKYDVLVTSYNLLQLEEKLFTEKKFATIVLDEAQAIKNRGTKRSKTVMNLKGDFRMITTGTPIENHLGELWNLFNFINPGLLGGYRVFNEKFATPIEKNKDKNSRKTLQKLIKPFILRRLKNEVLDDLPEKTEIRLTVEMSEEERAFYEGIRRQALEKIENKDTQAKDKRFRIFAELTRLRLACCHPKLIDKNIPLGSSKLDLFGKTIAELLENNHKALVFSQFVKHLTLVEEYLNNRGISYHYLDGSTPSHVRQERIDSFQEGKGDVFLISLKAGGTGLNLTAADYVIHLDPWWNPAVEDQATDRVHRIGQKRPVTVYRLVTENSVEEKILKLHETKRHLADSLLSEAGSSGKLTADDLLALIQEG